MANFRLIIFYYSVWCLLLCKAVKLQFKAHCTFCLFFLSPSDGTGSDSSQHSSVPGSLNSIWSSFSPICLQSITPFSQTHTHTLCVHSCPPCCFAIFFHGLFLYSKSTEKTLRCLAVRVETTAGDCYTHTPNRLAAARVVLEGSIVGAGPLYYKLLLTIFFLFVFFMFLFIWLGKIIIYLYFSPSLLRLFFYSVFLNECTLPEQD